MDETIKAGASSLSRRKFLKTAAATSLLAFPMPAIVRAQGTQKYLKPLVAGLNAKAGDPTHTSIARISDILREKYDVEMEIQVHPSSTLGTDLSQLEAVQTGFVDITSNVTGQFAQFSPDFAFVDLPYAITNWDMANRLFASDLWKEQAAKFAEATPLVPLPPVGAGGFRLLWNNQRAAPVPADVKGMRFRTTQSPAEIALVEAWGGSPTPLAWTETYNGLKTGLIDGIHVQPIWTYGFNMHEVLKHATEVDAVFAVQFQVINKNSLMSMPDDIREKFLMAAVDAANEANAADQAAEEEMKGKLREAGMEIYKPSETEKAEWQSIGEGLWDEYAGDTDPSVIERMVAMR